MRTKHPQGIHWSTRNPKAVRVGNLIQEANNAILEFKSVRKARRFMRTGSAT